MRDDRRKAQGESMTKDVLISISGLQMDVLEEREIMNLLKSLLLLTIFKNGKALHLIRMKLQRACRGTKNQDVGDDILWK